MDPHSDDEQPTSPLPDPPAPPPPPPAPAPWYPTVEQPLDYRGLDGHITYDGHRVTIDSPEGVETIPIDRLAAISIRDDPTDRGDHGRIVLETQTQRVSTVGVRYPTRNQAEHVRDELSRALAGMPATGQPMPRQDRRTPAPIIFLAALVLGVLYLRYVYGG